MSEKMTPKRLEMLEALASAGGPYSANTSYPPLKWLLEKGYAVTVSGDGDLCEITKSGLFALVNVCFAEIDSLNDLLFEAKNDLEIEKESGYDF